MRPLDRLARLAGVVTEYTDVWGRRHPAPDTTVVALLRELDVLRADEPLEVAADRHESECWCRPLPPTVVVRQPQLPYRITICVPESELDAEVRWQLALEDGAVRGDGRTEARAGWRGEVRDGHFHARQLARLDERRYDGELHVQVAFDWNSELPTGYHTFAITRHGRRHLTRLIVAPARCFTPPALAERRAWGLTTQLYSLRSRRNWGIGDFSDLCTLMHIAGAQGADFVGVNPLHALFPHDPAHASPYSPSSRHYYNIAYLDIDRIADFREDPAALAQIASPEHQAALRSARITQISDFTEFLPIKFRALERLYAHFRRHHLEPDTDRGATFRIWQRQGGAPLRRYATFHALQEHEHARDASAWGWPAWEEKYRDPDSPAVAAFVASHLDRVEFHEYLQWQAELQLSAVRRSAHAAGMAIGLYTDLAVSVDRGGADVWSGQDDYALGAAVGAPPDEINQQGQNWGLPPLKPDRMRATGYARFVCALRANMRHAGALRMDHVMGLARLYWVPDGHSATEGAYVSYPFEDLLGILALESHRHRCLVIGEDLGTVPDEVRAGLERNGVLSYRLLQFERDAAGTYMPPAAYPAQALVAATTHDLPTLRGFWEGHDIEVRQSLGLFADEAAREAQVLLRAQDRTRLVLALQREGLPASDTVNPVVPPDLTPTLMRAIHEYLARTPSLVMAVQLEDVVETLEQVNLPGTTTEQPNWRRKLSVLLDDLPRDERWLTLAQQMRLTRPKPADMAVVPVTARIPRATYRVQLHRDFTFRDLTRLIPYLADLGVSHVYCSPYLKARSGSTHGYDIIDHATLNPEIGTMEDFETFVSTLRGNGMGHLLDMVPNHMGAGSDNRWWMDVLENGRASAHAGYFDIEWHPPNPDMRDRLLVPVLGDLYGKVLESGDLVLHFDIATGSFSIRYHDHHFPIDPQCYPRILSHVLTPADSIPADALRADFESLKDAFGRLPSRNSTDEGELAERRRDKDVHKRHLVGLLESSDALRAGMDRACLMFNGTATGNAARMHELLELQPFRLTYWRVASDEINYRRFFDINDLAALRMEREEVFEATHRFVLDLAATGRVDGLRIDHPDGLSDPAAYFTRLQTRYAQLAGIPAIEEGDSPPRPLYVVIEKIAARHESIPANWAVYGTSGYRYATLVNDVLIDTAACGEMTKLYESFVNDDTPFDEIAYRGKRAIMQSALAAPLTMLTTELWRIAREHPLTRDYTFLALREALVEVVASFSVYRTYIVDEPSSQDRRYIERAIAAARRRTQVSDKSIFDFVRSILLTEGLSEESLRQPALEFATRFQQFTAPVTAKGVEDTAFYRYHRLVSLNDVGGDPQTFGATVSDYHTASAERAANRPHTMLASSTHDNKRSEDVRARINVLSEIPGTWRMQVRRWARINRSRRSEVDGITAPSPADEYLLYQTLAGSFDPADATEERLPAYCARIEAYIVKAMREAKVQSSWVNVNQGYEDAVTGFVRSLLGKPQRNAFLADLVSLSRDLTWWGALNSLSAVLLKLTSPGVPDIYQGSELGVLALVDPDNRRPVDYDLRRELLAGMRAQADAGPVAPPPFPESLQNGQAKLWLTWRLLQFRKTQAMLYERGDYLPLTVTGRHADHVIAYARRYEDSTAVTIVGRLWAKLHPEPYVLPLGMEVWGDTEVDLGPLEATEWRDALTGLRLDTTHTTVRVATAMGGFPGGLLTAQ